MGRQILKVKSVDHRCKKSDAKFTNKACDRPVKAKDIQTQLDLKDLQKEYDGKYY